MIISHKHKFIFLKCEKVAGTSVEIALSKFCGPDDVLTALDPHEEIERCKLGYPVCQNNRVPKSHLTIFEKMQRKRGFEHPRFASHIRARSLRNYVDKNIWDEYFKFAITRNPWDRVASFYSYRAGKRKPGSKKGPTPASSGFTSKKSLKRINNRGWGLYTINDEIAVDMVCRYENLNEDLEKVRLKIGLPEALQLPRAKGEFRKDKPRGREGYMTLFGNEEKERIAEIFKKEIDMFNYEM